MLEAARRRGSPPTTSCSPARRGWARRRWPASSPPRWACTCTSRRPGARTGGRPGGHPHQARRRRRAVHRRDPPPPRARSRRSCTRRWRTSSSTSSSARVRPRRIRLTMPPFTLSAPPRARAHHRSAARPVRLVARLDYYDADELRHDRRARRRASSASRSTTPRAGDRRPRPGHRASPTACCGGCATSPRCAAAPSMPTSPVTPGPVRRRRPRARQGRPGPAHVAVPAVRRRAGRPVDARDRCRRAARHGRGRLRAVPHPAGPDRPHAAVVWRCRPPTGTSA